MTITRPCYCSRDDVMRAPDFRDSVITAAQVDRALMTAADTIDGELHRHFYPVDGTRYFDWPNHQYASPWKLGLARHDLLVLTSLQSPSGTTIPLYQVFLEPVNHWRSFPYTRMELDRSASVFWGAGATPQHSIVAAGTWGFTGDADLVGTTTASITSSATTVNISDGSACGAGDVLILGYARGSAPYPTYSGTAGALQPYTGERVIVSDKTSVTSSLTQSAGCTTASASDNSLTTTGSGTLYAGEMILLDSERMLIEAVSGTTATVKRAWDGTVLATHSGATVYAFRALTIIRGELGTTAASATSGTTVYRHRPPSAVRDLNNAEAVNQVLQETSGYARTVGGADAAMPAPGAGLADKWDEVQARFGRQARLAAI